MLGMLTGTFNSYVEHREDNNEAMTEGGVTCQIDGGVSIKLSCP